MASFLFLTLPSIVPQADDILKWNATTGDWEPASNPAFSPGGDIGGSSSDQVVIGLQTIPISSTPPTVNQVLTFDGSFWSPSSVAAAFEAAGDLSGSSTSQTVIAIHGHAVAGTAPTTGQLLTYNGTAWAPANAPSSFTAGGDLSGSGTSQTVIKINGSSVPSGGSLTTGNVLQVSGASTLSYGALNLAGGTGYVSGLLPSANQASQTMAGDVSGTTASTTVAKINGTTVSTAGGALTTGNVLQVTGSSVIDYAAINLASSSSVTGVLPTANQASQALGGDLSGTTSSATVAKVKGVAISGTAANGYALVASSSSAASWQAIPSGFTAAGDLSGNSSSQTVVAINGTSVTATPSTNQVLVATSGSTSAWQQIANAQVAAGAAISGSKINPNFGSQNISTTGSMAAAAATFSSIIDDGLSTGIVHSDSSGNLTSSAVNLAGGSTIVSGVLPSGNQAAQTMLGDVTGTTAVSVVSAINGVTLSGTASNGLVLTATSSTAAHWAAAASGFTAAGDLSGSSSSQTVIAINGTSVNATPTANTVLVATSTTASNWQLLTNSQISSSAAIAGSKITPSFGSQNISTTGTLSSGALTVTSIKDSALSAGVVQSDSSGNFSSSAINLAGGTTVVTGVLPSANQASQTMVGDVTGTTAASVVAAINGTSVSATPSANTVLVAISGTASTWSQITDGYVSSTAAIAGTKISPAFGGQNISTTGTLSSGALTATSIKDSSLTAGVVHSDGSGNFASSTIINSDISSAAAIGVAKLAAGTSAQILLNSSTPTPTWTTVSGDAAISSTGAITVSKINGTTVPAGGSLATGNAAYVSGSSALTYSALNLAGGSGWVTGLLPTANQSSQSMGGDVSGTTASATVAKVNGVAVTGTPANGYLLTATSSSAATWSPAPGGATSLTGTTPGSTSGESVTVTFPTLVLNYVYTMSLTTTAVDTTGTNGFRTWSVPYMLYESSTTPALLSGTPLAYGTSRSSSWTVSTALSGDQVAVTVNTGSTTTPLAVRVTMNVEDAGAPLSVAVNFAPLLSSASLIYSGDGSTVLSNYGRYEGGDTVQIIGIGLSGATAVYLNGVAVTSFTVVSDTLISCVSHACTSTSNQGYGTVSVTTALGTGTLGSTSNTAGWYYLPAGCIAFNDARYLATVTDGVAAPGWRDVFGNSNFVQATSGNQPTYQAAGGPGGAPAYHTVATDNQFFNATLSTSITSGEPCSFVHVYETRAYTENGRSIVLYNSSTGADYQDTSSLLILMNSSVTSSDAQILYQPAVLGISEAGLTGNFVSALSVVSGSGTVTLRINGTAVSGSEAGHSPVLQSVCLGAGVSGGAPGGSGTPDMSTSFFALFSRALTSTDYTTLNSLITPVTGASL